jgi:hypothetical protein
MSWWTWVLLVVWGPTTLLGVMILIGFTALRAIGRVSRLLPTRSAERTASWLSSTSSTLKIR